MSSVTTQDILNCASLSRLAIDEQTAQSYASSLDKILAMMNVLAQVNTNDVTPLTNVHDAVQALRTDIASTDIDRDGYQAIAPSTKDGLYLVPQVIE